MPTTDSSFVGAVEKDSATLAAEHKSLFETANAHDQAKKVRTVLFCTACVCLCMCVYACCLRVAVRVKYVYATTGW